MSLAPLGPSANLALGFLDAAGTARTLTAPLNDLLTGLPLSAGQLGDALPDTTAPVALSFDTPSGTTTAATTTSGSSGGSGTTTTGGGSSGSGSGGSGGGSGGSGSAASGASPAGAITLANGSVSIPSSSVVLPYRLVIKKVIFTPKLVRAKRQKVAARCLITDTRGMVVRGADVWMRTMPLNRLTSVKAKRTSTTGWVTFTTRSTTKLKLKKGGRVNIFVRASTPGQPIIGGTSTRRLVSLRVSSPR